MTERFEHKQFSIGIKIRKPKRSDPDWRAQMTAGRDFDRRIREAKEYRMKLLYNFSGEKTYHHGNLVGGKVFDD